MARMGLERPDTAQLDSAGSSIQRNGTTDSPATRLAVPWREAWLPLFTSLPDLAQEGD